MSIGGKKVLVTGAGGFIGSHLAERLVLDGAEVAAFVHYNALGNLGWLEQSGYRKDMQVFCGDITDRGTVVRAMKGIDIVFHLAALIAIPYSYLAPGSYVRTNVEGTLNILQVALDLGIERVVHTSTSEVYGTARYVPIDEKHPLQGQSPYSATKIAADKLAEAFHYSFQLPVVTIRPFNTFGPRQSARAIIPTIVAQVLAGDRVRLGNLSPTRDFNFVSNTVDGFILGATVEGVIGKAINLGTGREVSIQQVVQIVASNLNRQVLIEEESARLRPAGSEVERLLADNTLARELLGWTPKVRFEDGLDRTIQWIQQHEERYNANAYVI